MKKKVTSLLLVAVMIISMIPTASATGQCLSADKTALSAGETVTLTYTVPNATADANAINLRISFDTDLFEATSVTAAEITGAMMSYTTASEANSAGEVVLGAMTMSDFDIAAGTVLVTAVFTAKTDVVGTASFAVAEVDIQGESGSLNATAGVDSTPVSVTVYSEITDAQAVSIAKPVKNGIPQTAIADSNKYTGSIQWVGSPSKFAANTAYTAIVTLTAKAGYKFADTASATVAGAESVTEQNIASDGSAMSFKANFEATAAKELSSIAVTTNPADLTYTHGETLNTAGMVVTATYDDESTEDVTANVVVSYNIGTALRKGDTSVSITYSGKTAILSGLDVAAKELTISGLTATNRVYNGETFVSISGGTLNGKIVGDDVSVTMPTSGSVASANVGTGKVVTVAKPALIGADKDCYTLADITGITVDITAASISPSVSIADWTYGSSANAPVISGNTYDADVTYEYKLASADDSEYNTTVPEAAGDYIVRATVAATANSSGNTCTDNFTISRKALSNAMIQAIASQIFTGSAIEPAITVKDDSNTLILDTDYTVAYSNNINVGTATVTITGIGNYSGTASKTFAITAKTITEADFSTLGTETKTYTGSAQTQTIESALVLGTDYTVTYSNNINVGTAKYVIEGIGNYTGSFEKTFTISPKTITEGDFTTLGVETKTYTGSALTQPIASSILSADADYTVTYYNNTNAGSASYTIVGKGNYDGSITKNFTIAVADYTVTVAGTQEIKVGSSLNKIVVTDGVVGIGVNNETLIGTFAWYTNEDCSSAAVNSDISGLALGATKILYWKFTPNANTNYNTTPKIGSVVFTIVEGDPQTLAFTPDTVTKTYGDTNFVKTATNDRADGGAITYVSSDPTVATVNETTGEVTILKAGTTTITATAAAIPGAYASGTASYALTVVPKAVASSVIGAIAAQTYTGSALEPTVVVTDGAELVLGTDYTVEYSNNINAGTATITITGKGNYTGSVSKTFRINPKAITEADFTTLGTETKTYSGSALTQTIESALVLGTDYTVTYSNNINAGTAKYVIEGIGNYTGSFEKTFTIDPKAITEADFATLGTETKTYSGSALTQTIASALRLNVDYTVAYSDNINIGTAKYVVAGKGNYTGSFEKTFTIDPKDIAEADFTTLGTAAKTYNGSALTQTIESALVLGTDYTVTYSNNINVGAAKYVIAGIGNYTGSFEKTFTINPKPVAEADFTTLGTETKTYNGAAQTQSIVSDDLVLDTNYTVTYSNNINAGTAKYVIAGIGNYTGSFEKTFTIDPKDIAEADFTTLGTETKTYNGSAQTQTVVSATLVLDTDYTVTYSNNTNAGTAKYMVAGNGNYTGSFEKTFTISPKSITVGDFVIGTESKAYNGSAQTQTVTSSLVLGTDYDVSYENNTYVGTATVTVTAKGNYTGTLTANFAITVGEYDLSRVPATLYIGSTYTPDTVKNAISDCGDVTISAVVVYQEDGVTVETDPEAIAKVVEFDSATGTVTAKGTGKIQITYSIAANNVDSAGADEYGAKTNQTITVILTERPSAPSTPSAPPSSDEEASDNEEADVVNPFVDIEESAYYYDAVLWAAENGITLGITETIFAPDATCTRGQMVTFLWRAAGSPEPKSLENKFSDVDMNSQYYKAILWAVENGITLGTGDGSKFSPSATCTRGQMAAFLYRSAGSIAVVGANKFIDVAEDSYYAKAVLWAAENGITLGTGDGSTFSPDAMCTRGQMVTFLYRNFVK